MWRVDTTDIFGIFAGIILGLGFFALIAYLVYLFVYKRIQMNHEIRLEMIRQGMPLPRERDTYGSLKSGMVLTGVGIGLFFAMMLGAWKNGDGDFIGAESIFALVPLFVGLGLILFHLIGRRSAGEPEEEPRQLSVSSEP